MDSEDGDFGTPSKRVDGTEQPKTTAGESRYQKMVESKYELGGNEHDNRERRDDRTRELDDIEREIGECGRRLEEIHYSLLKETDKCSEESLKLEQERTGLRKRVMDLDYQHRVVCAGIIKESRQRETEEKERLIKEAQLEGERRKQEVQDRIAREREQREKIYAELEESRRKRLEELDRREKEEKEAVLKETEEGRKEQEVKEGEGEDELARSRRKLRIAEIQSELASSRLRRSRIATLNSELDYLRYTYSIPYWSWRDYSPFYRPYYPYSSTYYPYYSNPYLYGGYRWL